jgi:hypothetical protein
MVGRHLEDVLEELGFDGERPMYEYIYNVSWWIKETDDGRFMIVYASAEYGVIEDIECWKMRDYPSLLDMVCARVSMISEMSVDRILKEDWDPKFRGILPPIMFHDVIPKFGAVLNRYMVDATTAEVADVLVEGDVVGIVMEYHTTNFLGQLEFVKSAILGMGDDNVYDDEEEEFLQFCQRVIDLHPLYFDIFYEGFKVMLH